jgi:Exopolysaccharide biosynthesis protein YbjH
MLECRLIIRTGIRFLILVCVLFVFCFEKIRAQSVNGIPGYVRIPTANFNPDGSLVFGVGFLPKEYLDYTKNKNDALAYYASLTFLPFLELDFRLTRILDLPDNSHHTVDRMPSIRLRLIKQKKWYPSVAVGVHDFLSSLDTGVARHFSASYLVCTRSFYLNRKTIKLDGTIGFGTDWLNSKDHEFVGLFGGLSVNWERVKWANVMIDYDGRTMNAGVNFVFFKHLKLMAGLQGLDQFTGTIAYQINL